MLYVVIAFLWMSILLYILLGGADFGAGVIQLFTSQRNRDHARQTITHAIGPIWEANHMWLIIAIVILFVGFPDIYCTISTNLHIPLLGMLIGIIARGTAFAFKSNDAVKDRMEKVYDRIFMYSSFITPFFLGIVAGSTVSGRIDPLATGFKDAYLYSWLNLFSIAVGSFTVAIFTFIAAVYLVGETDNEADARRFVTKVKTANAFIFITGLLVFIASFIEHIPLATWIFGNAVSGAAVVAALLSLVVFWWLVILGKRNIIRVLAGFQIAMILAAATYPFYPHIVRFKNGASLSLLDNVANQKTIDALGIALLVASVFILPALVYLLYDFEYKRRKSDNNAG